MKKTVLSFLLIVLVCALAVSVSAAEEHPHNGSHCICGGSAVGVHNHKCENIAWTAMPTDIKDFKSLSDGNYYLTQNLTVTAASALTNKKLTICLNGYNIDTTAGAVFGYTKAGCVINFCDCSGKQTADGGWTWGGTVTANRTGNARDFGGIINLQANSIVNVYGGNFVGADGGKASNGGVFNVCNDAYATAGGTSTSDTSLYTALSIYNGHITGGNVSAAGAAINTWHRVTVNLYGGIITGGTAAKGGNISISSATTLTIENCLLTNGTPASVMIMEGSVYKTQYATLAEALKNVKSNQYIRLGSSIHEAVTIPDGVLIDLAGNELSGVTVSQNASFMDSATNSYTAANAGKLTPAAGTVQVSYKTTTAQAGAIRRYLSIKENGSYSFHRFYVGITKITLKPGTVGMGYKATFAGGDAVKNALSSGTAYGYSMWLSEDNKLQKGMSADKFGGTQELTLRIDNFLSDTLTDQENSARSEKKVYASAYIRLSDGTFIESSPVAYNFREMLELANTSYDAYDEVKQYALEALSARFSGAMISWDIWNIHHADGGVWKEMTNESFNAMLKKSNNISAGSYVLTEDIHIGDVKMRVTSGNTVNICLNGHTLSSNQRMFNSYGCLSFCDCHADGQEGTAVSNLNVDTTAKNYAAIVYCYYNSVTNLYGGNLVSAGNTTAAGVVAVSHDGGTSNAEKPAGVFNMYGGTISGGTTYTDGGCITLWNKGIFNLYGGSIYGGQAANAGNINISTGCTFNMYGGSVYGGKAKEGYGGNIVSKGTLNMYGGTVTGGTALTETSNICKGGNIYSTSILNLLGGSVTDGTVTGMGGNIYSVTKKMTMKDLTVTGGKATAVTVDGVDKYETGLGADIFTTYDGTEASGDMHIGELYLSQYATLNATDLSETASIGLSMDTLGRVSAQPGLEDRFTTPMTGVKFTTINGGTALIADTVTPSNVTKTDSVFRVGYSMTNITTTEKGLTMSAWGNPNGRTTDGTVNYELYATTIAVTDRENNTFLMITVDLQGPPHSLLSQICSRISQVTGVPAENIYISATHTHNTPSTSSSSNEGNKRYRILVFNQLVQGAMEAMADRSEATMETGSFETVGMNWSRHYYYYDDNGEKVYFGDQFGKAPTDDRPFYHVRNGDTTMHMMAFNRQDKQPIIVVNWRAHPHRSGGREKYTLDADVIGATREYVHKNSDYLFAYFQGAAGNMNTTSRISGETYKSGKITEYGNELGRQLLNGMNKLEPAETGLIETKKIIYAGEVDHSQDDKYEDAVALKNYYYDNPEEMNVYENQIKKAAEYGFTSVFHATRLIAKYELGDTKDLELNIFSIGDSIAFYTAPAELWDSFSEEMEQSSPYKTTFCIGYCNGGVAYIPYKLDYYVSYEYFYCLFKQDDVINQMMEYYLQYLNEQYENN